MDALIVMTKLGKVVIEPGDKFQSVSSKHDACQYQFLGVVEDIGAKDVYLHDETHGKFLEVSRGWFANRSVRKIGGNEYEL